MFPWLTHLLPYRVSLDVARGGVALSWLEPALRLSPSLAVDSIVDLIDVGGTGKLATSLGLLPSVRLWDLALSAGPRWSIPWNGETVAPPGLLGRVAVLQERLALSVGVRSLSHGRREVAAALSVSDLDGLAYWLTPWSAGKR